MERRQQTVRLRRTTLSILLFMSVSSICIGIFMLLVLE
ncbi:hypothetical protein ACFX2I_024478 [Malus domestica]